MTTSRRSRLINLKVNESEYAAIERLAGAHAAGNMSEWLRRRGMSVEAAPEDDPDDGLVYVPEEGSDQGDE